MRIRKNAKLSGYCVNGGSSVFYGVDDSFQTTMTTHVCQLNQSPWDVISFASDYSPFQFDGDEDSFITGNGNGSLADSYGAFQSVATMMDGEDQNNELFPKKEEDNNMVVEVLDSIETTSFCEKTDGKNWHCKKEARQGESLCDHHLSLLRSYNNNTNTSSSSKTRAAGARRGKARAAAKKASSSSGGGGGGSSGNPYEFYYYSGFGPLWGKSRRGDKNINNDNDNDNDNDNGDGGMRSNDDDHKSNEGVENSIIREEEDIIEEEGTLTLTHQHVSSSSSSDEEEEGEDNGGKEKKKRMRKPVKARSLKSLM